MPIRPLWTIAAALSALPALLLPEPSALAAMKIRQPALEPALLEPSRPAADADRAHEGFFVGSVVFVRGGQMVAEVATGAREGERLIAYDSGLRRRGRTRVVRALEKGVYLLEADGAPGVSAGDRLARESETEAAARVLREGRSEAYREFLDLFPGSSFRPRVAREMFRLRMKRAYPTFPGSTIEGKVELAERVDRETPLGQTLLVLDRFVIARADERGYFRIEGLPRLDEAVELAMRVKDPRFEMASAVGVTLPAGSFTEVSKTLPVKFTPTVLAGRVVDERGGPLQGAEVWTSPYSMEALSDESGTFRISRRKVFAPGGGGGADVPLFGGEFEVYAYRRGYRVQRVTVLAESHLENPVPAIRLVREDPRQEDLPELGVAIGAYLDLRPSTWAAPRGGGPRINP